MAASSSNDASLAHRLLVELLAYQFAFPVRWIETQEHILGTAGTAQRLVEIGPSQVLAPMAKKTASKTFAAHDKTHPVRREFLSHNDHADQIFYKYTNQASDEPPVPEEEEQAQAPAPDAPAATPAPNTQQASDPAPAAAPAPAPAPVAAPPAPSGGGAPVSDKPLSATDVVVSLTAQKLKLPFDQLALSKSVRELSAGKSTLQNELLGIFEAEFGGNPNGAEELSLEALGEALSGKFTGSPGKNMAALISKLVSAKMPSGFNATAMKSHMESHWGLPKERQSAVVCFATTIEPGARIGDEKAAKDWLDSVVSRYGSHQGISLSPGAGAAGPAAAGGAMVAVDAESLKAAKQEQQNILRSQLKVLQKHLQDDSQLDTKQQNSLLNALHVHEDKLAQWGVEFDDDFFNGVKAIFDPAKARHYDSWWNWAREDVITLLHGISTGELTKESPETLELLSGIRNRLTPSCEELLRVGASQLVGSGLSTLLRQQSIVDGVSRPRFSYHARSLAPSTLITETGEIEYKETPRTKSDGSDAGSYSQIVRDGKDSKTLKMHIPYAHIRTRVHGDWHENSEYTTSYMDALDRGMHEGLTFAGKTALVTGAGPNSIGADIVKGLLTGGANVIVTTSREPSASAEFYQKMYRDVAGQGASLKVLPFNAASRKDCDTLIDYVYSDESGIPDLDFIVPFAAIPQAGQMDSLEGKSELAQRAMLTNVLRLLGCVRKVKTAKKFFTRPTNVLLPLSPNHGTFGGDGLYGESKLGLETLFNRGQSENWSNLLTITGVVIGWTRGTGLMSGNNITASAIEDHGVMTFSQPEMAFNVLALMDPEIAAHCEDEPIYADLTGGLHLIHDLKQILSSARRNIMAESRLRKALAAENEHEDLLLGGTHSISSKAPEPPKPRARLQLDYPDLPSYKKLTAGTANLQGMHDLDRVIVVVGYSELGPWGTARTRWEIEHANKLSSAGLIEMAWMMGLVKHHNGEIKGEPYAGWVDVESNQPVHDADFRERYEQKILAHSGLRFIEPEGLGGYNPQKKEILQEVVLEDDLPPFEASKASAEAFVRKHGDLVMLEAVPDSDDFKVHMKKGAIFHVPKAIEADRYVAGQLPKGFDPARYGIPAEIISQVDPVVVYALCCLSEAVLMAGLQDPLELYKHIHVSELANCLGTGAGSLLAMRSIYRDRYLDRPVQNDILQESYLNAAGAWSNMLLLASSGPIRSPTGTCATAIESLDAGVEAIKAGKAQVAVVGGSDDFQEEMSYEFGNMQATANTREELKKGRTPREMSRPTATSRAGFVESAGCGVQLIMTADLALKMGLSIYGVVGYTHMAGDKVGRSVPAPGQGILTAAKEAPESAHSLLLNLEYRREMLQHQLSSIDMSRKMQIDMLQSRGAQPEQLAQVEVAAARSAKGARNLWGTDIRKQDPNISPMRAALAVWGLTIDDISVASFHGTSTKANDKNESNVVNTQMTHLGRTQGNPLMVICQKYLTGHTKGAAGALMMNGGLQVLRSGKVPGNRNADNIDENLQQFKHLVFPSKTVQTAGVKAFMLTSFGFGQKGGLVVMIHPRYLFSAIAERTYEQYRAQAEERRMRANARFARGVANNSLFKAKSQSPWEKAGEKTVFLDPLARVSGDDPFKLDFNSKNLHPTISRIVSTTQHLPAPNASTSLPARVTNLPEKLPGRKDPNAIFENWLQQAFSKGLNPAGVGVDVQEASGMPTDGSFFTRNYTSREQEYCNSTPDTRASFAGRWAAKEAVFKCLQTKSDGAGAAMDNIEILPDKDHVPRVTLYGRAHEIAKAKGISRIDVSISHGDDTVMAVAAALKMDG